MYTLYGIKNCDTVKKARLWLAAQGIPYQFVDFKHTPPTAADLERWRVHFGEWPVNRQGTTYRQLKVAYEQANSAEQLALLLAHPAALKRPILEGEGLLLKGFSAELWACVCPVE
jgi:arsenate reductase